MCSTVHSIILNFILLVTRVLGNPKFIVISVAKPSIVQMVLYFTLLFSVSGFKGKNRFLIFAIIIAVNSICVIYPVLSGRNRTFFNMYQGNNIKALQIKNNNDNKFFIYNSRKYYDRSYIKSFRQFISFSGIKNADITVAGFDKDKISSDLVNFNIKFVEGMTIESVVR